MDKYIINNLVSPSSKYPDEDISLLSMSLSSSEKPTSGYKAGSSIISGKSQSKFKKFLWENARFELIFHTANSRKFNLTSLGRQSSRNNESREGGNTFDHHAFSQKFTISEENNSLESKDLFNFSQTETQKEMSPIAMEAHAQDENF